MVTVFDKYTDNTQKFQETMRCMDIDAQVVILKDDGFLPGGVLSPCDYFVYGRNREVHEERELYYDFLEVPEFWEIRSNGIYGAVYDMGCKKADIYFTEPIEKRNVQRVEWCMENGWVYKIDYYNKYALKYASEFRSMEGNVESRVFYSSTNQEVIVEQPQNDTVTLLENGKTRAFFTSYAEFIDYYIEETGLGKQRAAFIQDNETLRLWDLKSNRRSVWEYVLFPNNELLDKYISMGGQNGYRFYPIPEEYPENDAKGEVLILTATDQLEGIEYLIHELPEVAFHIAASTQVSDKLNKLGELANVEIYPQISMQNLNILWDKCDFYLDINYYREIHNAIDNAHQNNLLIMGFENTLHHRELVAEEGIFSIEDVDKLALLMRELVNNAELVQGRLVKQQRKKFEIWKGLKK